MKKCILAILSIIPLLMSCNHNERGFINPFPNDEYESKKIGFKFDREEIVKRTLTTQENELLNDTYNNLSYINQNILHREVVSIHERDYTRAFAGVFGAGYNISNMMYDEDYVTFYQEENLKSTPKFLARKKTTSEVKSTLDYDYGQNVSDMKYQTFTFLAKEEADETEFDESESIGDAHSAIEAKYDKEGKIGEEEDKPISAKCVSNKGEKALLPYLNVNQSFDLPTPSDPIPGANSENDVILVKEDHVPYSGAGEPGEYILPDGRKYRAIQNSLYVTRLTKETYPNSTTNDDPPTGEYYRVANARKYTEIAITSDVIQPNVPIEYLKNPIVINYREEFHSFEKEPGAISDEKEFKNIEVTE